MWHCGLHAEGDPLKPIRGVRKLAESMDLADLRGHLGVGCKPEMVTHRGDQVDQDHPVATPSAPPPTQRRALARLEPVSSCQLELGDRGRPLEAGAATPGSVPSSAAAAAKSLQPATCRQNGT